MEVRRALKPRLYIGKIAAGTKEEELLDLLHRYGQLKMFVYYPTRGYAFVRYMSPISEVEAFRCLKGGLFNGSKLDLNYGKAQD